MADVKPHSRISHRPPQRTRLKGETMAWSGVLAAAVYAAALAIGDAVAAKTKGMVSSVIVLAVIFLGGYWSGLIPKDAVAETTLPSLISTFGMALIVTNLGTMLDISQLLREWRAVLAALAGVVGVGLFCATIGIWLFGRRYALSAAGPLCGGTVATVITENAASAAGQDIYGGFAMLMMALTSLAGMPICAFLIKQEGRRLRKAGRLVPAAGASDAPAAARKTLIPPLPEAYNTSNMKIAKVAVVAALGGGLASLTKIPGSDPVNYIVNPYVAYLIFGVLFCAIGFLDRQSLQKANANGFLMFAVLSMMPKSFAEITPAAFRGMLLPLFGMLLIGFSGILLFSSVVGRLTGLPVGMSIAIATTAFFGYPSTEIVTNEAVKGFDGTPEEKKALHAYILPKMLVGGFVTVTITSVFLASIIAPYIFR